MDDGDIREALRAGDTDRAFRLLMQRYGPAVYAISYRLLRNPAAAEDLLQQTMLAAFRKLDALKEVEKLRGWLIGIAVRKAIDVIRSSKRSDRLLHHWTESGKGEDPSTNAGQVEDLLTTFSRAEELRALEEALATLDPDVSAAVLMRYRDGMSWQEIGDAVGMPADMIRMRVQRGVRSLRSHLREEPTTALGHVKPRWLDTFDPPPPRRAAVVSTIADEEEPSSGMAYLNAVLEDRGRKVAVGIQSILLLDIGRPRAESLLVPEETQSRERVDIPIEATFRFLVSSPQCRVLPNVPTYRAGGPPAKFGIIARRSAADGTVLVTIVVTRDEAVLYVSRLTLQVSPIKALEIRP